RRTLGSWNTDKTGRRYACCYAAGDTVRHLTMGKPDLRHHALPTRGDIQADSSGFLHDAAMRRALVEMEGGASVEVLEAMGALRLAAKQIHDAMERFAVHEGLSESRLRVLMRLYSRSSHRLALGTLAEVLNVTP